MQGADVSSVHADVLSVLRQRLDEHLGRGDVNEKLRNALESDGRALTDLDETQMLEVLERTGLVEEIFGSLSLHADHSKAAYHSQFSPSVDSATNKAKNISPLAGKDSTLRHLYVKLVNGSAFLESLAFEGDGGKASIGATLHASLHFTKQRFISRAVEYCCDPIFDEGFLFVLPSTAECADCAQSLSHMGPSTSIRSSPQRMPNAQALLNVQAPIHIVLIRTELNGERSVVGTLLLEWRHVLQTGTLSTSIEVAGVGVSADVPAGVLNVRMELLPRPATPVTSKDIDEQLRHERDTTMQSERTFLVYARRWWHEFLQIRPTHNRRLIKIFAHTENNVSRPVCSFVQPLRAGRLIDTPRQAARFVSLLGFQRVPGIGGGRRLEQWSTTLSFFSRGRGDCEDHALLLCSLLLGFGLEAYVCVGTKMQNTAHVWVMTMRSDGQVMFWESLTGTRRLHTPNPLGDPNFRSPHPYTSIGCVFNNSNFYANCQPTDSLATCRFDLRNETCWKAMGVDELAAVRPRSPLLLPPPLRFEPLNGMVAEEDLELQLRSLLTRHRQENGLSCHWDDNLSFLMSPALSAYELERVTGISVGNDEFQESLKRAIPEGHTFKGFPIQFGHRDATRIFAACSKSSICRDLFATRGDTVRFAIRTRIYPYPEGVHAIWTMFAVKYRSVL